MNAHDQQKTEEAAARRLQDEQDRVIEAIGELMYRRSARKSLPGDRLIDLRIEQSDVEDLADIAEQFATDDEAGERIKAAYQAVAHSRDLDIDTVADLTAAIIQKLDEIPAVETGR